MNDYALYLDDIRHPPQTDDNWMLCRTVRAMLEILNKHGIPTLASFDYELGRTDPGHSGDDAVTAFLDYLISHPNEGEVIELEVHLHTSSRHGEGRMANLLKQSQVTCAQAGIRLVHSY